MSALATIGTASPASPASPTSPAPAGLRQPADALGPRAQRTIARIVEATRGVFLTRGYSGTTIDEIARVANVSRASFYTYFPSKREVLLAVGANAANECERMIGKLPAHLGSRASLRIWVAEYFDLLDIHGSFAFAWTQAAQEDEEIRLAGMKRHYKDCKMMGAALVASTGTLLADPGPLGVVAFSILERSWNYGYLYQETVGREALIGQAANGLWGLARQPSDV
jgi:AcrR family transcriptional regulator